MLPTFHFSLSFSFLSDPRLESLLPSLLLFKIIQNSQKITASSTLKRKILWKGSWKSDIEAQRTPHYSTIRWQKASKKMWESYDCKPYHFSIPVGHIEWCQKKLVNQIKTAVKKTGVNYTPQIVEEMVPILTIQSKAYLFGSISKICNILLNLMLFSEKRKAYRNNQKWQLITYQFLCPICIHIDDVSTQVSSVWLVVQTISLQDFFILLCSKHEK